MFTISLLGGFYVERDGSPLTGFATDKARALLAYLVLERERPQRRESLAALLWPEQSDERARQSLRQALSHLKTALGDDFLLASPQDIQIDPQVQVTSDVQAFRSLLSDCQKHNHFALEACLPCLKRQEQAIALYRGEFLAGFSLPDSEPFDEWLILTRENLQLDALQALSVLAEAAERRADYPLARRYALEQVRFEPWREEAHAQVMRLWAYEGQRSAALAQYAACRRSLGRDLGLEPTQSTRKLAQAIQAGELSAPNPLQIPPSAPASFVGRESDQSELAELLASPATRLVTLLGPGGVGKTRLALQVARAHAGLYQDGIFFVPLMGQANLDSARQTLAEKLGLQTAPGVDLGKTLYDFLAQRRMLVVLDNFEQLAAESEAWSGLFRCASGVKWLVTSREKLHLREEWVYALEGLSYPKGDSWNLPLDAQKSDSEVSNDVYRAFDSLTLFETRAAQGDSRFRLTRSCLADIAAVCQLVEGYPLAIELAASSLAERSCADLLAALRQTFDALESSLRNLPERHRSLRAVFEHSWSLLKPEEQTWLTHLSVFVGGFSAEAAATVAAISSAQLADLAAKSLLRCDADGRYNLHESIRQFAAEKLKDAAEAKERHGVYYAGFSLSMDGAANAEALEILQGERANLRAAWEWSLPEHVEITAKLLPGLALLYSLRGPLSEGEVLFAAALSQPECPSELKTRISLELARLYNAQAHHDDAIALARSVPSSARALLIEGQALSAQGEGEAARPVLEKATTLAREAGDKRIEADCLRELGNVANRLCEYDLAVPLYQQALALARELGDLRGESATLNNWATVEWELGEFDAAKMHYEQALALYRQLGNRLGEAKALNNLSNVLADQGDLSGSLEFCRQALAIHREMGNPRGQSAALNNLGATYFCLKEYEAAQKSYEQALALHRASGNHQAEGETLANLSLLDCVQGRLAEGRNKAWAAIRCSEQVGDKSNLANGLYYLGRIELADRNFPAAEVALFRALDLRREVPHPGRIAEIQAELALLAFEQGDKALAAERIGPVVAALDALDGADEPERIKMIVAKIR